MFKSLCLVSSITPSLLHWYESCMFKLQRWWITKQFNIFGDYWQHFWSLILECRFVSLVEDKGFQQISSDCWHHLKFLTLEFGYVFFLNFFCFAPCYYKLFSIESTHKATRVLEGKNFLISYFWYICVLGFLPSVWFYFNFSILLFYTLLLQVFFY